MAVANIQETLLMYTRQKASINSDISDVMFDMLSATASTADSQAMYNSEMQSLYSSYYTDYPDLYLYEVEILEDEHELELANLNYWEQELELELNNLETQLNEISTFEDTWTTMLQTNIQNDFTYGGAQ
ncbi:MAG: hypothetical protein R3Y28_00645 [Candidatus Gastranaerophilales bacterium]